MAMTKTVKTTVLSLGISVCLATIGQAQTITLSDLKFVGGGSSALQGNYQFTPAVAPATPSSGFAPGAIPQVIQSIKTIGSGAYLYKNAIQSEHILLIRSVTAAGDITTFDPAGANKDDLVARINPGQTPAKYEVINDAEIRITPKDGTTYANGINIMVFLRTDSGQGVRYVANSMNIVHFPSTVVTTGGAAGRYAHVFPDPPTSVAPFTVQELSLPEDIAVVNFLKTQAATGNGIPITAGLSDVAADTVYRYAGFSGLNPTPPTLVKTPVAIQTLLLLYNSSIDPNNSLIVNIPQHLAQNITAGFAGPTVNPGQPNPIQWKNVDPRLPATQIRNAYRENSSGTRMTYLVDIMRFTQGPGAFLSENVGLNTLAPAGAPDPQNGTGTMVNTVDGKAGTYGYSFITGTTGNSRPNTRVAAYNGVLPYPRDPAASTPNYDLGGGSYFLPNNGGQPSYSTVSSTGPYYTETVNGRYPLWSQANAFTPTSSAGMGNQTIINSVVSAFALNPSIPYSLGFVLIDDLNNAGTFRDQFDSPVTGETAITDGMEINFDPTGASIPSPVVQ